VTIDFFTGLPPSQTKKEAIWVGQQIDKDCPLHSCECEGLYGEVGTDIYSGGGRLHGVSSSIMSDRDPRFESRFWKKFQDSMGTTLKFNMLAHPQIDGQSERVIQIFEDLLRAYVLDFGN
jgi:hypothetical protein